VTKLIVIFYSFSKFLTF